MSTRIKICGCRNWEDVSLALEAGADAVGMIFAQSPSRIAWSDAAGIARNVRMDATLVTVFVNPTLDDVARVRELFHDPVIQLSGDESPEFVRHIGGRVVKAIHVGNESTEEIEELCDRYAPALPLLDTKIDGVYGGTGERFDWPRVVTLARWRPIVIAGGLNPENVGNCVRELRPFGVDVRSGVESDGRKDAKKIQRFIQAVRESDAT